MEPSKHAPFSTTALNSCWFILLLQVILSSEVVASLKLRLKKSGFLYSTKQAKPEEWLMPKFFVFVYITIWEGVSYLIIERIISTMRQIPILIHRLKSTYYIIELPMVCAIEPSIKEENLIFHISYMPNTLLLWHHIPEIVT